MSKLAVQIAAKMYEAHDAMRRLWGDGFPAMCATHQGYIRRAMEQWKLEELPAAQRLIEGLQKQGDTGANQAMILAALVEMLEPSSGKVSP